MKKALFINYYFPHLKAIGSIRNYNLATELTKIGYKVNVLSTSNVLFMPNEKFELDPNIHVSRLPTFDYQSIRYIFKRNKAKNSSVKKMNLTNSGFGFGFMRKMMNSFPVGWLLGEGGLLYIFFGIIKGFRIAGDCDIVYSSFSPMSDHIIASAVKRLRPSIYWIADFRDVHVDPRGDSVLFPNLQHRINEWIVRRADILTVVSNGYLQNLKRYHSNTVLLRNGFSDEQKKLLSSHSGIRGKFSIAHTGNLYGGRRDPSLIFQAITELIKESHISMKDIVLEYAGKDGEVWKRCAGHFGLSDCVYDWGFIDYQKSLEIQQNCCINLLLTWLSDGMGTLPAKLYEYILVRNPIVVLINGNQDKELVGMIDKIGIGIVVNNDKKNLVALKSFILSQYSSWKETGKPDTSTIIDSQVETHNWKNIIKELNKLTNYHISKSDI